MPDLFEANTGGGLGVPQRAEDGAARWRTRWAAILAEHLGPLGVAIGTEPGDFLVKECAINLAEVVTVEERDGLWFVGVDVGWNAMGERFIYHSLLPVVLRRAADAPPARDVTISGARQRGHDLFGEDCGVPRRGGGRHRRGAQRGQLQRIHDVGALSATGGHVRVLHWTGSDGYARRDVRMSDETRADPCRSPGRRRTRGGPDRPGHLLVGGHRIAGVLTEAPAGVDRHGIDLSGHTVLPGPIDMHAHLIGQTENGQGYAELVMRTAAQEAMTGVRNARATVDAGFTTVRDIGTFRAFVDVALRDAIDAGESPGPRMMCAGAYLTASGGAAT